MRIGVPREKTPERRVAVTPAQVRKLAALGGEVRIESNAGAAAGFDDTAYEAAGAIVVAGRQEALSCPVVLQVNVMDDDPQELDDAQVVVGLAEPLTAGARLRALASRGVTIFALELLPRITRAQAMDALSSMATLAGYKAVLVAAERLPRMLPMMVTAAGTLTPAKALVVGAGVAGLQAIATARRLGAVVTAYDVRPEVKEEVESVGARFADLGLDTESAQDARGYARSLGEDFYREQRELMGRLVSEADFVITTAAVPGGRAPLLVTSDMVAEMKPGSVIVDLAAATGGNCELTREDELVRHHGVCILGPTNLPASLPHHASLMYANNITAFLGSLLQEGEIPTEPEDEIARETLVCTGGRIVHPRVATEGSDR